MELWTELSVFTNETLTILKVKSMLVTIYAKDLMTEHSMDNFIFVFS